MGRLWPSTSAGSHLQKQKLATESGEDTGRFSLLFPGKEPGDTAQVTVSKPGFVVVNYFQLRVVLPKNADAEPLVLVMCKESEREEWARLFYRIKSFAAIQDTYQKRMKELQDSHDDTVAAMAKLHEERDQAKAAADKAAEELARLNPQQTSTLYGVAMPLFLSGKVEEALKVLDEEDLLHSFEAAKKREAQAEEDLTNAIQGYLLRARLLTIQFRFDLAENTYKALLQIAPENFEAQFGYAYFSQQRNQHKQAMGAYEKALALARLGGMKADLADTLNNLGVLYINQNRMGEARQALEEALKIRRLLVLQNPETQLRELAKTLNNLGILDNDQGRMEEARQALEESLNLYRKFVQQNPETYLPDLAATLNSEGNLESDQNRLEKARQAFEESLRIRRQLAQKDPESYLPDVAVTLNNLGILDRQQTRLEEAHLAYEEALKIYRQLAQRDEVYLPDVAMTLNNLGILDRLQERPEAARQAYEEAANIYIQLVQQNPDTYLPYVATILNNLGNLYTEQDRTNDARPAYEEALKIRRQLAQQNPDTYLPYVGATLNNLGILYGRENQLKESRQALEESLGIYESLARKDPERFTGDVVRVKDLLKELESFTTTPK